MAAPTHADARALARAWAGISLQVARPPLPRRWAGVVRAGVPGRDVAILRASSGLHRPWVAAISAALVCAFLSSSLPDHQDRVFLLLAPLIPVLAVAMAYDLTDPMRELETSTPVSKFRIALLRASKPLAVAVPVTTAIGIVVPGLGGLAFVWLMPGLCLTVTMLLLLTWWTAWVTAGALAAGWSLVFGALVQQRSLDQLDSSGAQLVFAAIAVVAAAALIVRTKSIRLQGGY
ncbi:MAG TPA: hypothetical protein VEX15_05315 [Nocardioidaceae bacterium]|nr:hypothetical protein [Nocardioidaceae bacterium]